MVEISGFGKIASICMVCGLSVLISLTACGAAGSTVEAPTPVTGTKAQNIQSIEYEGMEAGSAVIVFDVMRPDGTVLTCATKKRSDAGASCFEKNSSNK